MLAATHPERVASLVLAGVLARWMWAEDYPIGLPEKAVERFIASVPTAWGTGIMAYFEAPSRAHDPQFRRWFGRYERLMQGPLEAERNFRWALRLDVRAVLPIIRVPTSVITFDGDPDRGAHARYVAERIPDAGLLTMPGQGVEWQWNAEIGDPVLDHIEEVVSGGLALHVADRVLATVLFTDIVSSTGRAVDVGDRRWTRLLDEHDAITDQELSRHRGRRIKTTGDGVLATFDGPARAIRCAAGIMASARGLGLRIRAGVHTGEVELRGDDIGGLTVHIAARISALAEPEEILVSQTVRDLVVGSGIEFAERGEHDLKGVPGRWPLLAVV